MKKLLLVSLVTLFLCSVKAQYSESDISQNYAAYFSEAYEQFPDIPKGILEAVAYTNTRITHLDPSTLTPSCTAIPASYGVMGLIADGKTYFRENLLLVASLSGIASTEIVSFPEKNILAYAAAYSSLLHDVTGDHSKIENHVPVLIALSELPVNKNDKGNEFAMNTHLYSVLSFMNDPEKRQLYGLPDHGIDMEKIFEENLPVLSAKKIYFENNEITTNTGYSYQLKNLDAACPDYPQANCSWVTSPNYSSRAGTAISAIAIHTVQGSYAGCVSWFQNTSSGVSTHYVVRSSDGQLTQMVLEANKAWHVAAENPYVIGYEHEGFVDNPAWYTAAMYLSSADLTRDICARQNIDPYRMFYRDTLDDGTALDYGLHSLGAQGSCIKIKGHQHFPNNTHTDPGPYWNWDYYFKLVNENPTITTMTAASGTFYDSGGSGANYGDDERILRLIQPTNAETVTITFTAFSMETNYDFLYIYDGDNEFAHLIGRYNTQSPGTITSTGGALLLEFRSDCSTTSTGWAATWSSTAADNSDPTTSVAVSGNWQTADFNATFTDADDNSIDKRFYQVLDWNGSEWRANSDFGFFNDNFNSAIHPDWTSQLGTWGINAAQLNQTNEAEGNSNFHIPVNQATGGIYLYQWSMKIGGTGTNRRAGMHFFSDDPTQTQRNNSYMVYFRVDQNKCQIYKSESNVITLYTDDNCTVNLNGWYDYKVIFNTNTGLIQAFQNDVLVSSWTDSTPLFSGNSISLRTGNCNVFYEDLKVYSSRTTSELVSIGSASDEVRYQNSDPATPSCRIKSIVTDAAKNFSTLEGTNVNIDWTIPVFSGFVNDGLAGDIDVTTDSTSLSANWSGFSDPNSGISKYWYCIGDAPGNTNIIAWTDNGLLTSISNNGLSLTFGNIYYYSVKAENNASLSSDIVVSDGQLLQFVGVPATANFSWVNATVCAGESVQFVNQSTDALSYEWSFPGGSPSSSSDVNPLVYFPDGNHTVQLIANGTGDPDTSVQVINVSSIPLPIASFTAFDTTLLLPPAAAIFFNSSTNATSYVWNFGNGTTSFDFEPWYSYMSTGTYTISLIASSSCGKDTLVRPDYLLVENATPIPEASFTYSDTTICQGDSLFFSSTSTNSSTYLWSFAGGSPSSSILANPSVFFPDGTHSVQLIATGSGGVDTTVLSITVTTQSLPTAGFYASDTALLLPNATTYFFNTSVNADAYLWYFGDSTGTYNFEATHEYVLAGDYSISLIAFNDCGIDSFEFADYIHVDPAPIIPPIASFTNSITTICEGIPVSFTNTSTDASSWYWSFSGGIPATDTIENPVVYFPDGTCTVVLIANGPGGTDTISQQITVTLSPLPTANFSAFDTTLTLPSANAFFSNTSANATSYYWDFGDGASSTDFEPFRSYSDTGNYTVSLTATNSCGSDVITFIGFITVTDGLTPPSASYTYSNTTICEGELIQFTNTSANSDAWYWNFGTGTPPTSTAQHPSASFPDGTHNISLIAFGNGGSDTISQQLTVSTIPLPVANFTANDTLFFIPNTNVFFTNTSQNADFYFWDFGDGSSTTDSDPWHHYVAAGNYSISLMAVSSFCGNDTLIMPDYITLEDPSGTAIYDSQNTIAVFPNPFLNEITIWIPIGTEFPVSVTLTDITGRVILQKEMRTTGILNGHELAGGVYCVTITSASGKSTFRLVKE